MDFQGSVKTSKGRCGIMETMIKIVMAMALALEPCAVDVEQDTTTHKVKTCPCSPQCTCGCNEGEGCTCGAVTETGLVFFALAKTRQHHSVPVARVAPIRTASQAQPRYFYRSATSANC